MSAGQRSINQRLTRAKAPGLRAQIVQEWAINWKQDQTSVLRQLEQAERMQDWHRAGSAIAQLRAVTEKRFAAFPGVVEKLAEGGQEPRAGAGVS
jgi:hypothetical protein